MSAVRCARNFLVQYADKFQIGHEAACFFAHFSQRRMLRRFFSYYRPHRRLFLLDFSCAVLVCPVAHGRRANFE